MAGQDVFSFKKRIESIQVLRFFLAILVFLSHFDSLVSLNISFAAPVFIFYTVSAFVAMLSTADSEKTKGFLKRRIVRLLPLYWAITIFTFAATCVYPSFMSYTPNVVQLLKSLFCIPFARDSTLSGRSVMRPILGPAHTLEVEVFFSLVFFVCIKLSHKKRGLVSAAVCAVFFSVGMLFEAAGVHCELAGFEFYIVHNRYAWLYFFLGIVLYAIFERAEAKAVPLLWLKKFTVLSGVLSALIFVSIFVFKNDIGFDVFYCLQALAGSCLLFFLVMLSQYRVKAPKALVFCGNISFSFYLIHYYVVNLTEKIFGVTSPGAAALGAVATAFAISFSIACVSHYLFEKKLPQFILSPRKKSAG